jgi:hypothetical protein
LTLLLVMFLAGVGEAAPTFEDLAVPRYGHIFVVMDENKSFSQIDGSVDAPVFTRLARTYGSATHFFAETHPSEGNYVALLGGSTFDIRDDAAYIEHTVDVPHLGTQLEAMGLRWKGYYQSIPEPGSRVFTGFNETQDGLNAPPYYASKHSGFLNFNSVQRDPRRAERLVGFDALRTDLASGKAPNFAFIVPNLCDDMHGMALAPNVPDDCRYDHLSALIRRGDAMLERIVGMIQSSALWRGEENVAIVITFDEDDGRDPQGGGRIPTAVMTNHGPRGVTDARHYDHYALLRTLEDAFGIHTYLGNAAGIDVHPMLPLFRIAQ